MRQSQVGQALNREIMGNEHGIVVVIHTNHQRLFTFAPSEIVPNKVNIFELIRIDIYAV